ncbi:MAG: hypothetical protein HZA36_01675 [Parcubacteria group bacterium]|nr:hypothetical protein [Parcubacteria group bacterium]
MNDILGTIKRLKHIEPERAYLKHSKKRLFAYINPTTRINISALTLASSLSLCSLSLFFIFHGTPSTPTPLASLDTITLTEEFNKIDLQSKITEVKTRDSKNRAIDRAIQNLAYTGKSSPQNITSPEETNDKIDQLLDELL